MNNNISNYIFDYNNSLINKYLPLYEIFPSEIVTHILSYISIEDISDLSVSREKEYYDSDNTELEYIEYDSDFLADFNDKIHFDINDNFIN